MPVVGFVNAGSADADREHCGRVPQGPQRNRLRRRPERDGRIPLAGGPIRSPAGAGGRSGPPPRGRDRHAAGNVGRARGQSCDSDDPDRLRRRRRPGQARSCRQPRPAGRQRDRHQFFHPGGGGQAAGAPARHGAQGRSRCRARQSGQCFEHRELRCETYRRPPPPSGCKSRSSTPATIGEIDAVFASLARERPDALFVAPDVFFRQPRRAICHLDGARQDSRDLCDRDLSRPAG